MAALTTMTVSSTLVLLLTVSPSLAYEKWSRKISLEEVSLFPQNQNNEDDEIISVSDDVRPGLPSRSVKVTSHIPDQQPQSTGHVGHVYHEPSYHGGHHSSGSHGGYHDDKGHKVYKGFLDKDEYKDTHHNTHSKGHKSGHGSQGGKSYKGHGHKKAYVDDFTSGKKGSGGHHKGSKGHHNKGNNVNGYKKVWHMEEHGHQKKYYDDYDHKKHHHDHDDYDEYHHTHDNKDYKGEQFKGGKHHDSHGDEGYVEKGSYHDDHEGHDTSHGNKGKYGHEDNYEEKEGSKKSYGHPQGHGTQGSYSEQVPILKEKFQTKKYEKSLPSKYNKTKKHIKPNRQTKHQSYATKPSMNENIHSSVVLEPPPLLPQTSSNSKVASGNNPKSSNIRQGSIIGQHKHNSVPLRLSKIRHPVVQYHKNIKFGPRYSNTLGHYGDKIKSDSKNINNYEETPNNQNYESKKLQNSGKNIDRSDKENRTENIKENPSNYLSPPPRQIYKNKFNHKMNKNKLNSKYNFKNPLNSLQNNHVSKKIYHHPADKISSKSDDLAPKSLKSNDDIKIVGSSSLHPIPVKKNLPDTTQQVSVVIKDRLESSASGKHGGKSSGHQTGSSETHGDSHKAGGHKSQKYKSGHHDEHAQKHNKGYEDTKKKQYSGDDHETHYKGDSVKGEKGGVGHHLGTKGHHNKGHIDKGFKNVHHKFEYAVNKKFYDDFDDKNYHGHHDEFDEFFKGFKSNNLKGHGYHGNDYHGYHDYDDYYNKGHDYDLYHGHKGYHGDARHHGHEGHYIDHGYRHHDHGYHDHHGYGYY